jgi:hypothetical protein
MSKSTAPLPPENPPESPTSHQYNRHAYEPIIHEQYNRLKARLMNLAESTLPAGAQCSAAKGLMKDFLNQAYFETLHNIEPYLTEYGVLDGTDEVRPIYSGLTARNLSDILVNE